MGNDNNPTRGFMTRAVHSGESPDAVTGASAPNIVMSSTFVIDEPVSFSAQDKPDDAPYVYSRWDNPTVTVLQDKLAALEEAEVCRCFASGMAAADAILSLLESINNQTYLPSEVIIVDSGKEETKER